MILEAVFKEEEAVKADFGVVNVVKKVDASIVANALKGTASGTLVSMKDVSPLKHEIGVKLSSATITDFSSVTLTKYGKNLADISQMTTEKETASNYADFVKNVDGTYTFTKSKGNGKGWQSKTFPVHIPAGTPFTFSTNIINEDKPIHIGLVRTDDWWSRGMNSTNTEPYDVVGVFFYYPVATADGISATFTDFQLEIGTATEYEPYNEPETVSVSQDGTATIIGKGESITLETDTEGVTITAEYNKDLNKVVNDIYQKLSALGVAVVNN